MNWLDVKVVNMQISCFETKGDDSGQKQQCIGMVQDGAGKQDVLLNSVVVVVVSQNTKSLVVDILEVETNYQSNYPNYELSIDGEVVGILQACWSWARSCTRAPKQTILL